MYRIFCESYNNFINSFSDDNYRLEVAKPLELLIDLDKYYDEKEKNSMEFKKVCDLMNYMKRNIEKYPKLKAFLWTLESRDINNKPYNVSSEIELEEQSKLINSILKLAYWY